MTLKIYNSKTRKKEEFKPLRAPRVSMYVCGPTVYDKIHIGNARTFLSFDVIRRYLMHKGYDVTFAQNVTDVDDKIIKRAEEKNIAPQELAKAYTQLFIEHMHMLNVLDPSIRPKATHEISAMIDMIQRLIEQNHAYATEHGDVYFAVRSCASYGEVSGKRIDDLLVGARIEENTQKHDPLDFALWKAAKPGEPSWESPWGAGRPGWHTECSAMVHKYLGTPIDIHGGGSDLSFPHHENESAQACSCWHEPLAYTWMHTGMLLVNGEKMSKSLGNFYTLEEVLAQASGAALRLLMLQTHYRNPLDFSFERLQGAQSSLDRIVTCIENARWYSSHVNTQEHGQARNQALTGFMQNFEHEMDDDFNTAGALGQVFECVSQLNQLMSTQNISGEDALHVSQEVVRALAVLGIELPNNQQNYPHELLELAYTLTKVKAQDTQQAARMLIEHRAAARAQKDWKQADFIRDELKKLGLVIEDTAQGARIKVES